GTTRPPGCRNGPARTGRQTSSRRGRLGQKGSPMLRKRTLFGTAAVAATMLLVVVVTATMASPATGITPTVLSRGTFTAFKDATYPAGQGMFKAEATDPIDIVVRKHEYAAGASTGWHAHTNPVFITVTSGTLTFYKYD